MLKMKRYPVNALRVSESFEPVDYKNVRKRTQIFWANRVLFLAFYMTGFMRIYNASLEVFSYDKIRSRTPQMKQISRRKAFSIKLV